MEFLNDLSTAVVMTVILGAVGAYATLFVNVRIDHRKKKMAYHRLRDDPYVYEGIILHKIIEAGSGNTLIGRCKVLKLEVGRLVVVSSEDQALMTFTGREFETLHPVVESSQFPNLLSRPLQARGPDGRFIKSETRNV